jgi:hypothetical protein
VRDVNIDLQLMRKKSLLNLWLLKVIEVKKYMKKIKLKKVFYLLVIKEE